MAVGIIIDAVALGLIFLVVTASATTVGGVARGRTYMTWFDPMLETNSAAG